jgi:hypothetical protein
LLEPQPDKQTANNQTPDILKVKLTAFSHLIGMNKQTNFFGIPTRTPCPSRRPTAPESMSPAR